MSTTPRYQVHYTANGENHVIAEPMKLARAEAKALDMLADPEVSNAWVMVAGDGPAVDLSKFRHVGPKKITARFESPCRGCGAMNAAGSTVYYSKETGALCAVCGPKHYRTLGRGRTVRNSG